VVRVNAIDYATDFSLKRFCEGARATYRYSKSHRIGILTNLNVVKVSLARRFELIVYHYSLVNIANSNSDWRIVKRINIECSCRSRLSWPILVCRVFEAILWRCSLLLWLRLYCIGHLIQHGVRIVIAASALEPAIAPSCYKK